MAESIINYMHMNSHKCTQQIHQYDAPNMAVTYCFSLCVTKFVFANKNPIGFHDR